MQKKDLERCYIKEKKSTWEIAKEVGVAQITVWRWLKKYNIPRRSYKQNKMPVKKGSNLPESHKKAIGDSLRGRVGKRGSEHPRWKGGKRIYRKLAISSMPFKCAYCGAKEKKRVNSNLHAHHIDGDRNNNKISNLIILCASCHKKAHIN